MKLELQDTKGNTVTINPPHSWEGVTLRSFMELTAKEGGPAQIAYLCGLTVEQYLNLGSSAAEAIAAVLEFTKEDPVPEGYETPALNVAAEAIWQMELAKQMVKATEGQGPFAALPYLHAIYTMPERIDPVLALTHGFPGPLADEVLELPVTEVFGPSVFFLGKVFEITEAYGKALYREPDPDLQAAGFERLNRFSFYGALVARAAGDYGKMLELLQMPAIAFYTMQVYEAEQNDCMKLLQEIKNPKLPN